MRQRAAFLCSDYSSRIIAEKSPLGAVSGARFVSLGGVTLTTPSPVSAVSNIINRAKQNVTSSTPVLLQPANR